ncbi:uncharacterized protein PG986_001786 [Apiospora aurea]|uniref:Uncharacterized protein n=1 Tax=Apiospora aurea TaxID=335848 RepID=A0ABR1QXZ3_9PEZI
MFPTCLATLTIPPTHLAAFISTALAIARRGHHHGCPAQRPHNRRLASRAPTPSRCRRGTSRAPAPAAGARCYSGPRRQGSVARARCAAADAAAHVVLFLCPLLLRPFPTAVATTTAAAATNTAAPKTTTTLAAQPAAPARGHRLEDVEADAVARHLLMLEIGLAVLPPQHALEEEAVQELVQAAQVADQLRPDLVVGVLVQRGALPGAQDVDDAPAMVVAVELAAVVMVRRRRRRLDLGSGGP